MRFKMLLALLLLGVAFLGARAGFRLIRNQATK
jgi:hypothetical protein